MFHMYATYIYQNLCSRMGGSCGGGCLFWTWATTPCLHAAAITVSEAIQVCSYSCPLAGSPSILQVWSLSTSSLHGEHLSTPPSHQHSLQLSLLFASPQANDEIFGIMVKRHGGQRLGVETSSSGVIHLVSHVLVVSCFEFPWISPSPGSFSCAKIWFNFDRWPCQGAEGRV